MQTAEEIAAECGDLGVMEVPEGEDPSLVYIYSLQYPLYFAMVQVKKLHWPVITDTTPTRSTVNVATIPAAMCPHLTWSLWPKERTMPPLPTFSNAVGLLTSKSGHAGGDPTGTAARMVLAGLVAVLTTNAPVLGAGLPSMADVVNGQNARPIINAMLEAWLVVEPAVVRWTISQWNGGGICRYSASGREVDDIVHWIFRYAERLS